MGFKILVISSTPWNTNNSFGNSYANIFDGLDGVEIANIYCMEGVVNDPVVKRAYKVSAKDLVRQILTFSSKAGKEVPVVNTTGTGENRSATEKRLLNFAKKIRWQVLFWGQELIWKIGHWNNESLQDFVHSFSPDLLFVPIYGKVHMCRIDLAVQNIAKVPMLGYISDDNYTLRQMSFSPLYWMDRLYFRRLVKKVIDACDQLFVISKVQKQEYDAIFHKDCHILTKGADFSVEHPQPKPVTWPLQMVFAGNIGSNRWKSLALIAKCLRDINQDGTKIQLTIYTATPLTRAMSKALNVQKSSCVAGRIPYSEVMKRQQEADILVHVEATDIQHRWGSHQGFSTKLVDYMMTYRPILAYGLMDQASIAHLRENDAALVATTPQELVSILHDVIKRPRILQECAEKAWCCGARYHDIHKIHTMLQEDFRRVLHESCTD